MIWRVYLHERTKDPLAALHAWPVVWLVRTWAALDAYDDAAKAYDAWRKSNPGG